MPLLSMENISISFFGTYANKNVSLRVEPGSVHALLGENGAGKTTLMNILFGIYKAESGRVFFDGREMFFSSPEEALRAGIGMVHQHFSLVNAKTVLDNILLGIPGNPFFLPRKKMRARVLETAAHYGLQIDPDKTVGECSIGEKQRVEILKALFRDIKLLILDEPTAVLTPGETAQLFDVLRALRQKGLAVILITHRMSEIMNNTDEVTVLRAGECVGSLRTCDTTAEELSRMMVGEMHVSDTSERHGKIGPALLELENLSVYRSGRKRPALENVTLTVHSGEIVGIAGVEGNGQKELAEAIVGIRKRRVKGTLRLGEDDLTGTAVRERAGKGLSYVPDDRTHDGLVPGMDIGENLILRAYRSAPYACARVFRKKAIQRFASKQVVDYRIRTAGTLGIHSPVRMLSGGNQQKVILAREITQDCRFIVASQPTRGLDVSASAFVHEKLLEQRDLGKGILLISADLEEIMAMSDRIAVMYNGRIAGILDRREADVHTLGLMMGGLETRKEATA